MVQHRVPRKHSLTLLLAAALLAASGCGGEPPSTLPPDPVEERDAGTTPRTDAGTPDSGVVTDGGNHAQPILTLNVVGDPTPEVVFEGKIALQAILVHSENGGVEGESVTFEVAGGGSLSTTTATTDATGIARVEYTAGTTAGLVHVIALAANVAQEDRADWAISVVEPNRSLQLEGPALHTLYEGQRGSLAAMLTQRGRPVAGARVTFSANGTGLMLGGQLVSSKVATTNLQGIATIDIEPRNVTSEHTVGVTARADYAVPLPFSVTVQPKPSCDEPGGECEAGQICGDEGACIPRPQCSDDYDIPCASGFVCESGVCVPEGATSCSDSGDCETGQYCDVTSGRCLSGCATDGDCTDPMICDANHRCVSPTTQDCVDDTDCAQDYVCAGGRCIPNVSGGSCTDSSECDMGHYCNPAVEQCIPGCDSDERCVSPKICDLASNTCITKECDYDEDCADGKVCVELHCVDAPAMILDVSGEWSNMVQTFHVADMLPENISNVLGKVDEAFTIAAAVLGGRVGDLLPDWVPGAIKDAISNAVKEAAGDYLPEWAQDVVHIGGDVLRIVKDFEIRSTMTIVQPYNGDPNAVHGVDKWQSAVFYWFTADCPPPSQGQAPDECAVVQVDLVNGMFKLHETQFNGRVQDATLTIDTHNISFQYGKAVRVLLEMAIEALTGYSTILEALQGYVDCAAVNTWVQETAANILGALSGLLETFGMSAEEVAASINVTSQCTGALNQAASLITTNIEQLSAEVPISMAGSATITREPDNTSSYADHLVRGKWNGTFNGKPPPSGKPLADWYADR